ncbi:MAG: hypothetical protein R2724_11820 [Bryobacterales bacterium]
MGQRLPQNFQAPPNFSPYQLNGQNARAVIRDDYSIPYKTQWNLTIERQFGDDLGVSVAYVANKGTHLATTNRISEVPAQYRSPPENVLRANINSALAAQNGFGEPFLGFSDLWGSRATVAQSLRLYPQFGNLDLYGDNLGNSNYNSFQSKIDKRYKGGLSGTFAYTWSKNLDDLNFQSYNHRDYSYSDQDHTHVVSLSFLYQLPFGKGKKLLSGASGAIDKIVGGWQIGGVGFYSSGQRLAVTTNNTLPYFNASRRPDIISNDIRTNVSMSDFDPAKDRFSTLRPSATPRARTVRQLCAAPERGAGRPRRVVLDQKNTKITERFTHQFRLEMNNPLNRVVFANPNTSITSQLRQDQRRRLTAQHPARHEADLLTTRTETGSLLPCERAGRRIADARTVTPAHRPLLGRDSARYVERHMPTVKPHRPLAFTNHWIRVYAPDNPSSRSD